MVTMNEVARAAGVSTMTVSNVINGHPHVSDEKRDRVLRAVDELGYRVNVAARNLRAGKTGTIGLSVPELDRPYFAQLAARISSAADAQGYRIAVEQTGATREQEIAALLESRKRMYDGLILSTVALGPEDSDLLRVDYPVVILGERIFEGPADHVAMPNVEGTQGATAHLADRGCRRIAMLGGPYSSDGTDVGALRRQGYRRGLEDAGLDYSVDLMESLDGYTAQAGAHGVIRLLDRVGTIDGLVCITDTVAFGAMRALRDRGLVVPDDVKVVGFDALAEGEFSIPTLTSVDPDHDFMANTAVRMLIERIETGKPAPPREVVSPFTIRLGESTGR